MNKPYLPREFAAEGRPGLGFAGENLRPCTVDVASDEALPEPRSQCWAAGRHFDDASTIEVDDT